MDAQEASGPGPLGRAALFVMATAALLWEKATQDGHLAAFGRQGLDELGVALKAFPESIQAHEPGAIFEPTQGEVAAARRPEGLYGQPFRSPSEIAADRGGNEPEHDHGRERGQETGHER
jgi:hypothetical protein